MIHICNSTDKIQIPRYGYCKKVSPCNTFILIIQHIASNRIIVFRVINIDDSYIRYTFRFKMPDDSLSGQYKYYLVTDEGWNCCNVDNLFPECSVQIPTGHYTLFNGYIFITEKKLSISDDESINNEFKCIDIISTGLIKYDMQREKVSVFFDYKSENDVYFN